MLAPESAANACVHCSQAWLWRGERGSTCVSDECIHNNPNQNTLMVSPLRPMIDPHMAAGNSSFSELGCCVADALGAGSEDDMVSTATCCVLFCTADAAGAVAWSLDWTSCPIFIRMCHKAVMMAFNVPDNSSTAFKIGLSHSFINTQW